MINPTHDLDYTVAVYIVHQDKVLLIKHRQLDRWLPVGGHIEPGEDPDQALLREIAEECGLPVTIINNKPNLPDPSVQYLYTPLYLESHMISQTHRHVALVYVGKTESPTFIHKEDEHTAIRWFSIDDLANPVYKLTPSIKHFAGVALDLANQPA